MAYTNPTVSAFQLFFSRDFPFGSDPNQNVLESDIVKAFAFTDIQINQALWSSQNAYQVGYYLLAAHYLVTNLRASSQGLNGQYSFLENSKGVGPASQGLSIPQKILDNPEWAMLCKTNYGAQYIQLVLPNLVGAVYTVCGQTRA